jgi:replication-associated recombination protein RarA
MASDSLSNPPSPAPSNKPLYERYRPGSWEEVIGQSKIVNQLRRIEQTSGLAGRAYWLSGKSGSGKSSLAYLIANSVAGPKLFQREIDAQDATPAELSDIERDCRLRPLSSMGGKGSAIIINEAHGLRRDAVRKLLVILERLPQHVAFIFTTTLEGEAALFDATEDAHPLLSRCLCFKTNGRPGAEEAAKRLQAIAAAEQLDGRPLKDYVRLFNDNGGNWRACFQAIEAGEMLP